jgi:hypothetical protein
MWTVRGINAGSCFGGLRVEDAWCCGCGGIDVLGIEKLKTDDKEDALVVLLVF